MAWRHTAAFNSPKPYQNMTAMTDDMIICNSGSPAHRRGLARGRSGARRGARQLRLDGWQRRRRRRLSDTAREDEPRATAAVRGMSSHDVGHGPCTPAQGMGLVLTYARGAMRSTDGDIAGDLHDGHHAMHAMFRRICLVGRRVRVGTDDPHVCTGLHQLAAAE